MDWKVKLQADDSALAQLQAKHTDPTAKVTRDGIDWYLESTDFEMLSDANSVRARANEIVQAVMASAAGLGNVYRMHYDGSKTVYSCGFVVFHVEIAEDAVQLQTSELEN